MTPPILPVTNSRRNSDERAPNGGDRLQFGPFVLDPREGTLLRDGVPLPLAPKPFETLAHLAARAGHVIPKQELLDAIWPGTFVTDDVLVQCIVDVRRALGDSAKEPRWIQTLPKRGYRFIGRVEDVAAGETRPEPAASAAGGEPAGDATPLPERRTDAGDAVGPAGGPPAVLAPVRRRGPIVLAAAGFGLAVLLAVGWAATVGWTRLRAPVSAEAPAAAYAPEDGTVAILPVQMVELAGDTAWLREGLAEIIALEITNDPALRVVPRQRLLSALRARGVLDGGFVPLESGLLAARDLRVERLVTGSFQRVGQQFTLVAQIVDVAGGAALREVVVRGERRADLLDAVSDLCRQLAAHLAPEGTRPATIVAGAPPTRSEDALRAYTEALMAEAQGGRENLALAEQRLADATTLDPGFARAFLRMAIVQQSQRRWGYGGADPAPAVRSARNLEGHLPERERLLVRGMAALYVDAQPARAIELWSTLLKLYPTYAQQAGVPTLIADTQLQLGRFDDLILTGEAQVEAPGLLEQDRALLSALLARAFQRRGEFDRAAAHASRAVDLWPVREGPAFLRVRTALGRIQADAGRRDRALEIFRAVSSDSRADVVNVTDAAWGLYMAGEPAEAAVVLGRALRLDDAYANAYHLRGWLRLVGGDYDGAASDLREAYERTPHGFGAPETGVIKGDLAALYYEGVAHAKAGRAQAAEAAWRELVERSREALRGARGNPIVRWQAEYLAAMAQARLGQPATPPARLEEDEAQSLLAEARLNAVLGRRTEALESLRQAISLGAGEFQHIRDDPNFDALRTSPEFLRLLQSFGRRSGP